MANVLVFEPDDALCDALCALLADEGGHAVDVITNDLEAVARLGLAAMPCVVVLDGDIAVRSPGGWTLLELAADLDLLRDAAFVVLTTATPRTLPPRLGYLCGLLSAHIVWMPFETDELLAAVADAAQTLRARGNIAAPPEEDTGAAS